MSHLTRPVKIAIASVSALFFASPAQAYEFKLSGGYFFGPGPIVPDTSLPDGAIRNVEWDFEAWEGHAPFEAMERMLSDKKTLVNANIDAGELSIGEGQQKSSFWLAAVNGGPNAGKERYALDERQVMNWVVDLALDPGFPEGIVSVDGFTLTTGWVKIMQSEQSELNIPGGYDKAGSLASGDVLTGRVGDFDYDGFLDGILVASARVPMQSELLPGAPVGNRRGFTSDIPVDPLMAAELVLHGVIDLRPLLDGAMTDGDQTETFRYVNEIRDRIAAAQRNYEDKFLAEDPQKRKDLREMGWRLEAISKLVFVSWAFLNDYTYPPGYMSASVTDAMTRSMNKMDDLVQLMADYRAGGTQ